MSEKIKQRNRVKGFLLWTFFTVALAAVLHFVIVWQIPSYMTKKTVGAILARKKTTEFNRLFNNDLSYAKTDVVVMSNADMRNSIAFYDVSEKPLKIHCVVPKTDNYWSISLYAWNTDNFFIRNDQNAKAREFDLILVKSGSNYQAQTGEEVVESPTNRGVILIRYIVANRADKEELARIAAEQEKSFVQPIDSEQY